MSDESRPSTRLRALLASGCHPVPGAFNAAVGLLAERLGFPAVYASGAAIANGVAGVPDLGLLTLTEVAQQAGYLAQAVRIPVIADADTGFGEPLHVPRCVREFERAGVAAIQIEDQELPKRCGHLAGKRVVPPEAMARKIAVAVAARRDPDFVIIARVDSRGVAGLDDAIRRGQRYREAGADVIFPEGLESAEEFAAFARAVPGPLLANMTEFGRTPYLTLAEFAELGYRLVIYPMTAFRIAMKAVEAALAHLRATGSQRDLLERMQTREELYALLRYEEYLRWDERVAGFEPPPPPP